MHILRVDPQNNDPRMSAWRVAAYIPEAAIESDHQAVLVGGGGEYVAIGRSAEGLFEDSVDVVAKLTGGHPGVVGQILVELQPH